MLDDTQLNQIHECLSLSRYLPLERDYQYLGLSLFRYWANLGGKEEKNVMHILTKSKTLVHPIRKKSFSYLLPGSTDFM